MLINPSGRLLIDTGMEVMAAMDKGADDDIYDVVAGNNPYKFKI